jgi:predicted metal-dependent hydrolase
MWHWHATEEIEHKGLAFDIWYYATRDWNPFKRWLVRSRVGVKIMRLYLRNRVADALGMMAQDGLTGWRGKWRLYSFLWGRPGVLRRIFFEMGKIVLPGFHPWKHDNSHLIRQYKGTHYFEEAVAAE